MRALLAFLFLITGSIAHAEWVESEVIFQVNTTDEFEIASSLSTFPNTMGMLSGHNLAGDSKVKVQNLFAKISKFKWQNDQECKVTDPESLPVHQAETSTSTFIYVAIPDDPWVLDITVGFQSPCESKVTAKSSQRLTKLRRVNLK